MTNEEKAVEFDKRVNNKQVNVYAWTLQMAKWKDQQFKEYLEKKRVEYIAAYDRIGSGCGLDYVACINEIINELFGETEQDNSDKED